MTVSLFLSFEAKGKKQPKLSATDRAGAVALVRGLPGVLEGRVYAPSPKGSKDPYLDDGAPPVMVVQLEFATIADLEAVCTASSPLRHFGNPYYFPSLAGATGRHQAFAPRRYPVPEEQEEDETTNWCSYLVEYEGPAEDWNEWMAHYVGHHPYIMAKFPEIVMIEISSPLGFVTYLPYAVSTSIQRNKVVFESQAKLNAALASPVRHEMRADFKKFPPFKGGNTHFAMDTRLVLPAESDDIVILA